MVLMGSNYNAPYIKKWDETDSDIEGVVRGWRALQSYEVQEPWLDQQIVGQTMVCE